MLRCAQAELPGSRMLALLVQLPSPALPAATAQLPALPLLGAPPLLRASPPPLPPAFLPAGTTGGQCPMRKFFGPLGGLLPLSAAGHLQCPSAIIKMRAAVAALKPVRDLRPQVRRAAHAAARARRCLLCRLPRRAYGSSAAAARCGAVGSAAASMSN